MSWYGTATFLSVFVMSGGQTDLSTQPGAARQSTRWCGFKAFDRRLIDNRMARATLRAAFTKV